MKAKVEVTGVAELRKNMQKLAKDMGAARARALIRSAELVRGEVVKAIQDVSQGEQVVRSRAGGDQYPHTASAPGDAPNTDTGALARSVSVEIVRKDAYVGSTLPYAGHLEFGTRRMKARPVFHPTLRKNRKAIQDIFTEETRKEAKREL